MKKKLGIIIPVLLVLVIGGFAAVYFAMPGNTADDTAPLPPVFDQTETPDTRPTTENLSASVELSESELHEIFEEVYLDSVYELRNYLEISKSQLLNSEYDRIELACQMGKTLPTDYKDQYNVWREEYRVSDMSYIFTDEDAMIYTVKEASYTYTNIYQEAKLASLPTNTVVFIEGIGYDKGEGWLKIYDLYTGGYSYIEADKVVKAGTSFSEVSKTMYAIEAVNTRVKPYENAEEVGSLQVGESVHVIGIGELDVAGWYKVEIDGQEYYVRSEYLSDEKPVTNTNNSGGNQSSNQGSNQGGNQGNNGGNQSGGNNGSGNNGGDSGNTSSGSGESSESGTGNPYLYTPPTLTEEQQEERDRENREDSGLVGSG